MTNDLIAERIDFFRKGLEDVAQLPSDQQEMTHQFIQEKLQWLETQKERAAQMPAQEQIEITNELITERLDWLEGETEVSAACTAEASSIESLLFFCWVSRWFLFQRP